MTAPGGDVRGGRAWVDAFAARLGTTAPDDLTADALLELASVAAHASERLAAPLACYVAGRAGLDTAEALADALHAAREV